MRSSASVADTFAMLVSGAPVSEGSVEHHVRTVSQQVAGMRIGARGDGRVAGGLAERREGGWRSRTGMRRSAGDRARAGSIAAKRGRTRRVEKGAWITLLFTVVYRFG